MDPISVIFLVIAGFFSGIFVGLGSGTTGSIMITCLTVILNHSIHKAIGTTLLIDSTIGGIAGLIFFMKRKTNFKPAFLIALIGAVGSFIGGQFTSSAPEKLLIILVGSILIILGGSFLIKGLQVNIEYIGEKIKVERFRKRKNLFFVGFALFAGFTSGFTGMGIGGVIALVLILILRYDLHTAIGSALLMIFFISGAGTISHALNSELLFSAGFYAGSGAIFGAVFGSLYANKINEEKLGRIVGALILIMGFAILFRAF